MSALDTWRIESDSPSAVGSLVHPTKVLVVEAMLWIDRPVPATDLVKVFDGTVGLAAISYQLKSLAVPEALEPA